jgi:phospholipid-translocating ATPase
MSKGPTGRAGQLGGDRPNVQETELTVVNDEETAISDDGPAGMSTMLSNGGPPLAMQPLENAGESAARPTVDNEPRSDEPQRQPPRPFLNTPSSISDEQRARPSLAVSSLQCAGTGPSTRPQISRSKMRNRGYSLRRSMFRTNIQSQAEPEDAAVEMHPAQSAAGHPISSTTTGKSEQGQVSLTISTFAVDKDSSITSEPPRFREAPAGRHLAYGKSSLLRIRQELLPKLKKSYQRAKKILLQMKEMPPTPDGRHVNLDFSDPSVPIDERTGMPYISNVIRSSRYTLLNFFPRQLLAQFSKLANFYFLIVSVLQMIPGLSTTGTYTTIVPLLIFVGISMAKEGYDDIRRWRLDKEENNRDTLVLDRERHSSNQDKAQWKSVKWHEVKLGDVLLLSRDDPVPADLVLLHAESLSGAAYIEVRKLPAKDLGGRGGMAY